MKVLVVRLEELLERKKRARRRGHHHVAREYEDLARRARNDEGAALIRLADQDVNELLLEAARGVLEAEQNTTTRYYVGREALEELEAAVEDAELVQPPTEEAS